jgi:GT2 family glycosyltransferase
VTTAQVSYVVVAFHRVDALEALLAHAAGDGVETIVVNVEADPEIARVATAAGACVVEVADNVGYAAAVNAGAAVASADVVVFSNDDLLARAADIVALADVVRRGNVGVAVPAIVDRDGHHERTIAALPTVGALAREWMCLPDRPVPFLERMLRVAKWRAPESVTVVAAATAAFVTTTRDLLRAEPLPEAYFLYWEESEWFWRLAQRGVVVEYHPEITVQHLGGRDDVRPDKARLLARNAVRCVRRTQGRWRAALAVPVVIAWNLRLLVAALLRRRWVDARLAGVGAAFASVREVLR